MRKYLLFIPLLALLTGVAGCCSIGIGSCKTTDKLTFVGADKLNSCTDEQSHPVAVRIYYLKQARRFEAADFESLWFDDRNALEDARLEVTQTTVNPGSSNLVSLTRPEGATHIGLLINFCKQQGGCWREVLPLEGGSLKRTVELRDTCLAVQ